MKCAISIIVPCYNVEQYLDRCMKSLLNRTMQNIEIILVDDGSPDTCPELCDEYARLDKRVKVIHKDNAGLGFARNSGLEIATGEYIAFVDSDDFIDLNMYATLYEFAKEKNCDAVFCGVRKERKNHQGWLDSSEFKDDLLMEGIKIESFMLGMIASPLEEQRERKYSMSVWRAIYRKTKIVDFNLRFQSEREIASEDLLFNVSFLRNSKRIGYISKPFYHYCYNSSSLTTTFKKNKFPAFVKLYQVISRELKNIPDAQIRCDRFIIGYTRSHLIQMFNSNLTNKLNYIKDICNHPLWNHFTKGNIQYKPNNRFQKIFYNLLISNKPMTLFLFCWSAAKIKRITIK